MLSAVAIPPPDSQPSCEVLSWLSLLPSTEFPTELTPSKPPTAKRKRKLSRIPTDSEVRPKCLRHSSPGSVLLDPSATDMAPRPPSTPATPNKGGRPQKGNEISQSLCSPPPSSSAKSRSDASSSLATGSIKPADAPWNVREALGNQNMLFDDVNSFEKYPEFKAYVHKIVFRERESAMAKESIRRVHQAARDFAARDEAASQMAIMPKVIKPSRGVPTNKRTASDVIKQESRFFEDDDLATASRLPLSKGFLPLVDIVGKKFGLTNPTPDVIYGLKYPTVLGTGPAKLSDAARAAIGLVTGVRHAFFLIECKGPTEGIEQAENQAIRGGATLVAARRFLNRLAKGEQVLSLETPGIDPIGTEHGAAQTDPAEAEINNLAAPNTTNVDTFPATSSTIVPPQSFVESAAIPATPTPKPTTSLDSPSNAESPGGHPDFSSIAFSCSWATQMANIFVHWCECRNDGPEIYHMIKLHGYLYGDDVHLADLREHSHNILDWGVDPKRRQELAKLEMDIEKMEKMKKGRVS